MNAPNESVAEHPNDGLFPFPELLRSQSSLEDAALNKRKSLRTRPAEHLERQNTGARAPLRDPGKPPELRSKLSLFNLFSKPKVERLRGYAEQGLTSTRSNIDLRSAAKVEASAKGSTLPNDPLPRRPTTSKSLAMRASRATLRDQPPPVPAKDKPSSFDNLPLFQAWPQAVKHAILEVSTITPEMSSQKSQSRRSAAFQSANTEASSQSSAEDTAGIDAKNVAHSPFKHGSKSSVTGIELPKKQFILSTSGYLLQYAENGASDRVPEKILRLGKDSAAFACDLIPGKHHVLEILQNVDDLGANFNTAGSILSKLGIRTLGRRQTTNFLLVMSDANAMTMWMSAIRQQIEVQGGKRARSDSFSKRPKTGNDEAMKVDLKKTPSQSHRYQVRRDPSRVSIVTSPATEKSEYSFDPPKSPAKIPDDIEQEATKPVAPSEDSTAKAEEKSAQLRPRAASDSPSVSSSETVSVDQEHLDHLRESTRMSRTSATNTLATSRTNSLTSSPPAGLPVANTEDMVRESGPPKVPVRTLSSYTAVKRRSVLPASKDLPSRLENHKPAALNLQNRIAVDPPIDSPVLGHGAGGSNTHPEKRFTLISSAPDLKSVSSSKGTRDPRLPSSPLVSTEEDRPVSFVGDLPPPSAWSGKASLRMSLVQASPAQTAFSTTSTQPLAVRRMSRQMDPSWQKRLSHQSFSLPLKVNLSDTSQLRSSPRSPRSDGEDAELRSPVAAVHTLTAKVDPASQASISPSYIPPRRSSAAPRNSMSSTDGIIQPPARHSSSRLSLFPSPVPTPTISNDMLRRSPSATALMTLTQAQTLPSTQPVAAASVSLRRPTSMQIRSDHAPFLSNVRSSVQHSTPQQQLSSSTRSGMPVPIRSLKPSRSMSTMQQNDAPASPPSTTINRRESLLCSPSLRTLPETSVTSFSSPNLLMLAQNAAAGESRLASAELAPATKRTASRRNPSRTIPRASLPELDLGMSIVALGPPAPPPSAPLPQIPGSLSTPSPGPIVLVPNGSPTRGSNSPPRLPLAGLGIQVGS